MGRIEKTVFISYRHTNEWTALAVWQHLNSNGYDVFIDYKSIPSGDFEQTITENIKSRAHFIVILSSSALENCSKPDDWLRREIEIAIESERNIIPLMMKDFDFGSPATLKALTGKLEILKKYQALSIPADYFDEAMIKLRGERFLNRALETVFHPVSEITKQVTEAQKTAASSAAPVETGQLSAVEWFERGFGYYNAGNLGEAIRCYTESIRLETDVSANYLWRATARRQNNDLQGALADYDEFIRREPNFAEAYTERGIARRQNSDLQGALADSNQALRLKSGKFHNYYEGCSGDFHDYYERGIVYQLMGDLPNALADFDEAIRINPNSAAAHAYRGRIRGINNDLPGALADLDKAIRLNPDFAGAYIERGIARIESKDIQGALVDLDKAIQLDPDEPEAYIRRGVACGINNDLQGALADLDKAIQLGPDLARAYYERGIARRVNDDLPGALADLDKAIQLGPDLVRAYYERGIVYQLMGDLLSALTDYQITSSLKPSDVAARVSQIGVLRKLSRNAEAREYEKLVRKLIQKEDEYNQACFESICGNIDKALELLKIGLEKGPFLKEWARQDPDFENIRDDPRFRALVD